MWQMSCHAERLEAEGKHRRDEKHIIYPHQFVEARFRATTLCSGHIPQRFRASSACAGLSLIRNTV